MPKIPDAVNKRMGAVSSRARDRAGSVKKKLRQLDPKAARVSAAQGAGGAKEAVRLAVAYAKQETIDPVKSLGRYLAYGAIGAILMGFGMVLLTLGLLRRIQTGTGHHLTRTLSWIPYSLTALAALVALVLVAMGWRRSVRNLGSPSGGNV